MSQPDIPWSRFLARIDAAGRRLLDSALPRTPQMQALAHRHLLRLLRAGTELLLEFADRERPVLHRTFDLGMAFALDNPDTLYHHVPVLPGATYRLHAQPAGAKPPHFVSVSGMVFETPGLPRMGAHLNNANRTLGLGADGGFEVHIGAQPRTGNWLHLEPSFPRQTVFVRQTFHDWEHERPLHLALEREDAAPPPPTLSVDAVNTALELIPAFVEFQAERWLRNTLEARARGENVLPLPEETPDIAGLTGQRYAQGFYRVPPGQALLVTFRPPATCGYWGVQLASWLGESLDYAHRRVSINGHQGVLDHDGALRAVLAAEDPGVPNWLDIGGGEAFAEGLVILRLTECGDAAEIDAPRTRLVPLDGLRAALPPDHPHVDAQARRREMRVRRRHLMCRLGQ